MKKTIRPAMLILFGTFIFAGLPLLGWGVKDAGAFFEHPARFAYVVLILVLQVVAVICNPGAVTRKEKGKGAATSKLDLYLIQILSLLIVFFAPYTDSHSSGGTFIGDAARYLGLVFVLAGFALMQLAEKYLDKQFSVAVVLQENHRLVTTGPYKYVRHPRYLGIVLFFTGIALVFHSRAAMGLAALLAMVLVWRVFAEEALLKAAFKAEWDAYSAKSWRIIPYLF